jgi:hypothetical protein
LRTDVVKIITLTTKRVWKLPTSIQLLATWHTDLLEIVVLSSTGALRYHNFCIDGGTSPEYFGYPVVHLYCYNCLLQISSLVVRNMWNVSVFEIILYCNVYSRITALQGMLMLFLRIP